MDSSGQGAPADEAATNALDRLRDCLRRSLAALRLDERDDYWGNRIATFLERADSLAAAPDDFGGRRALARDIHGIYGGMGSFNDPFYGDSAAALRTELYRRAADLARDCWRALGNPWFEVPEEELFEAGEVVRLVAGEVIAMDVHGNTDEAPRSPLEYTVLERAPPDVDNMPCYTLRSGDRLRVARHNALRRVINE